MSEITRPKIRFLPIVINVAVSIAISACIAAIVYGICKLFFNIPLYVFFIVAAVTLTVIIVIRAKRFIICSVRLYQKFAPMYVRERCCFNPSCSEYMIQAVEKYGVIKGVKKGLDRLDRCHYPNFGDDPP